MKTIVETPYSKMWKEDGILYCKFIDKLEMNLEIAKICVEARIKYSEGKSYPCLINMQGLKSVTKEVREYMATEGAKYIKAGALLIGSPLTRIISNIFLAINTPPVPTKLFTDENEAKKWLKQYL